MNSKFINIVIAVAAVFTILVNVSVAFAKPADKVTIVVDESTVVCIYAKNGDATCTFESKTTGIKEVYFCTNVEKTCVQR